MKMKLLPLQRRSVVLERAFSPKRSEVKPYRLKQRPIIINKAKVGTLSKLISHINTSLSESKLIKPIQSSKYSININEALNKSSINEIKRMKYEQQWYPSCNSPPSLSQSNAKEIQLPLSHILMSSYSNKLRRKRSSEFGLMLNSTSKETDEIFSNEKYRKTLRFKSFSKRQLRNSMISKKCLAESVKNSPIRSYANDLLNHVEKYVHYAEKYMSIYEFDDWIKNDIIEYKTGLFIPGNVINRFNNSQCVHSIQVVQPSNVKEKFTKVVQGETKTLL